MPCRCSFPPGLSVCHCARCHRSFTSSSAFDLHQRLTEDGLVCLDPADLKRKDGHTPVFALYKGLWGQYDKRGRPWRTLERENKPSSDPPEGHRVDGGRELPEEAA